MLAIFHKAFANPPEELNSPASHKSTKKPKQPEETLNDFLSHHPHNTFSMSFGNAAVLAYVRQRERSKIKHKKDAMVMLFQSSRQTLGFLLFFILVVGFPLGTFLCYMLVVLV
ncbi:hypothetical protein GOBAR_DD06788 [Gossypium barbadense]|nr:hypothetical protein GOBAR_DD06788 [Gossypium barbadense]